MTKLAHTLVAVACCLIVCGLVRAAEPSRPPVKIKEVRRLENTVARLGGDGDNWHMTWTADDRVVAGLCDGAAQPWPNVPHRLFNSRLISIRGAPPKLEFADTPGYPELLVGPTPRETSRYYGFGILAVDNTIYQFLSTPDRFFENVAPQPRFVGAKLIYSPDNGRTWHNRDGSTPVRWELWEDRSRDEHGVLQRAGRCVLAADRAANGKGLRAEQRRLRLHLLAERQHRRHDESTRAVPRAEGSHSRSRSVRVLRCPKARRHRRMVERHCGARRRANVSQRLGQHEGSSVRLASERRVQRAA